MNDQAPPEVRNAAGYTGGWYLPIICSGRMTHPLEALSFVFEHEILGTAYTAPPATVHQTRQKDAVDVPGRSRESLRFLCPTCGSSTLVDRRRFSLEVQEKRENNAPCLDVAEFDRPPRAGA